MDSQPNLTAKDFVMRWLNGLSVSLAYAWYLLIVNNLILVHLPLYLLYKNLTTLLAIYLVALTLA
jgi:hypothetical protein